MSRIFVTLLLLNAFLNLTREVHTFKWKSKNVETIIMIVVLLFFFICCYAIVSRDLTKNFFKEKATKIEKNQQNERKLLLEKSWAKKLQ